MLVVTPKDLPKLTEADLLKVVLLQYELDHPREKALEAFASITGLSPDTINNARSGKGFKLNLELYHAWYEARKRGR